MLMKGICESSLAVSLLQELPKRLTTHPYTIVGLAQEIAQESGCPLCEIMTPIGEALMELADQHQIVFDRGQKQLLLA